MAVRSFLEGKRGEKVEFLRANAPLMIEMTKRSGATFNAVLNRLGHNPPLPMDDNLRDITVEELIQECERVDAEMSQLYRLVQSAYRQVTVINFLLKHVFK